MSKTPVSLLHELLVKSNMVPNFELIFNGVVLDKPLFKYMATAGRHTAEGTGRSKQAAKQDSARNLLAILDFDDSDLKKETKKKLADDVSKTPVSLLHELLVNSNMVPNFELIFNGVVLGKPLFKYMATAGRHTAEGTGRSKQAAKQDSAKNLLAILDFDDSDLKKETKKKLADDVQFPYPEAIKNNAIGALQEFCTSCLIPGPIYELIRDEGLPHNKIFGMRCTVSSCYTEGEAQTKKQAKHLSAKLMLDKLKGTLETDEELQPPPVEIKSNIDDIVQRLEAIRLNQRPPSPLTNQVDLRIGDLHQSIKEFVNLKPSSTLEEVTNSTLTDFYGLRDPKETVSTIVNELQFQLYEKSLHSNVENVAVVAVVIKGPAKWTFLGCSPSQLAAFKQAYISALIFLVQMSS